MTYEARERLIRIPIDNALAFLAGQAAQHPQSQGAGTSKAVTLAVRKDSQDDKVPPSITHASSPDCRQTNRCSAEPSSDSFFAYRSGAGSQDPLGLYSGWRPRQ